MSMKKFNRDNNKRFGIKKLFRSFYYSFQGIKYAFLHEQNMFIHTITSFFVISMGIVFKISLGEWIFVILMIGLVISTELINTAIEALVDLVSPNINPLAKIIKDTLAGAVFIYAITAFVGGLIIFIPKILSYINNIL